MEKLSMLKIKLTTIKGLKDKDLENLESKLGEIENKIADSNSVLKRLVSLGDLV